MQQAMEGFVPPSLRSYPQPINSRGIVNKQQWLFFLLQADSETTALRRRQMGDYSTGQATAEFPPGQPGHPPMGVSGATAVFI